MQIPLKYCLLGLALTAGCNGGNVSRPASFEGLEEVLVSTKSSAASRLPSASGEGLPVPDKDAAASKLPSEAALARHIACRSFLSATRDNARSDAGLLAEEPAWAREKRDAMVDLIANYDPAFAVTDSRVLKAMRRIPRHKFVPSNIAKHAYDNGPLPIGEGQTISQPFIVGYMTQALELKPGDKVLEIGTGSGYQAAILAELDVEVYTIEIVESLAKSAQKILAFLGYGNIKVKAGDGYRGWPEYAPFDAIIVTCAPDHIPKPLNDQLKTGGRMIIPVGGNLRGLWAAQELILVRKTSSGMKQEKQFDVRFVPMTGQAQE